MSKVKIEVPDQTGPDESLAQEGDEEPKDVQDLTGFVSKLSKNIALRGG